MFHSSESPRRSMAPPKRNRVMESSTGCLPAITRPPALVLGREPAETAARWTTGKECFAHASAWMTCAAAEGRRPGERDTRHQIKSSGKMTLQEMKNLSLPIRRLVASSGAVTAREFRHLGKDDRALLEPLSDKECSMRRVLEQISVKAAEKFTTVRAALRNLDADLNGTIDREELRVFFRTYGLSDKVADEFFDHLDTEQVGELDYGFFTNFIRPYLGGAVSGNPLTARDLTRHSGARVPDSILEDMLEPEADHKEKAAKFAEEFAQVLELLGRKILDKHGSMQAAFRHIDKGRTGSIKRSEMRYFFRSYNIPQDIADKFHDAIDANRSGDVSVKEFCDVMRPYVKSDHEADKASDFRVGRRQMTPSMFPHEERGLIRADPIDSDFIHYAKETSWMKDVALDFRAELRKVMQDIGDKLPLKYKHVRDAFRFFDKGRTGRIQRQELQDFFHSFGHSRDMADRVFDLLDDEGRGYVDYAEFMSNFEVLLGKSYRQTRHEHLAPAATADGFLANEINSTAKVIAERMMCRYKDIHEAFRAMDSNKDGKVSQYEMRTLVTRCGLPQHSADMIFRSLEHEGSGYIHYEDFVQIFEGARQKGVAKGNLTAR
eukprot:TRINITY_DN73097_c0_g1_i1.p1 TRINITY_DN73097_c0_g1~~TRINITY_DN73097_c0_g1_i1.p1  ORF type:complete len:606 (-),score=100.55 TRINITY_DN73097_c0_g1_i1:44-1861(-)